MTAGAVAGRLTTTGAEAGRLAELVERTIGLLALRETLWGARTTAAARVTGALTGAEVLDVRRTALLLL